MMTNDNNQKNPLDAASLKTPELNEMSTMTDNSIEISQREIGNDFIPTDIGYPVNFEQVGYATTTAEGSLVFNYKWQSSTGSNDAYLIHLSSVDVGEKVDYPETNPEPGGEPIKYRPKNPPFNQSYDSPFIKDIAGSWGKCQDEHKKPAFAGPYRPDSFTAQQVYRYHGPWMKKGVYADLVTGMEITRSVYQEENGEWKYKCTKEGEEIIVNLPPYSPALRNISCNLEEELEAIQKIEIGSTRGELLQLFCRAEGLSTPGSGSFQYRKYPNIYIDATFEYGIGKDGLPDWNDGDKIKTMSPPYLASVFTM